MSGVRVFAVTSGWDGPFQLAEAFVAAATHDDAIAHAERAFSDAGQPVCRAKMRIADLGDITDGAVLGLRTSDGPLDANWRSVDRRCDPEGAPNPS